MKYYIVAGEASGDLHGSNLMKGLYREDPGAHIRFWGGPLMNAVFHENEEGEGLEQTAAAPQLFPAGLHGKNGTDAEGGGGSNYFSMPRK